MFKFPIDELLNQMGIADKYELTRRAIYRVRELVKERDKRALEDSTEKLPIIVLREIIERKAKSVDTEKKLKENTSSL